MRGAEKNGERLAFEPAVSRTETYGLPLKTQRRISAARFRTQATTRRIVARPVARGPPPLSENSPRPGIAVTRLVQTSASIDAARGKRHGRRRGSEPERMRRLPPQPLPRRSQAPVTGGRASARTHSPIRYRRILPACAPSPGASQPRTNRRIRDNSAAAQDSGNLAAGLGFAIGHLNMLRAVGIPFECRRAAVMELFRARLAERPLTCSERRRPVVEKPLDVKNLLLSFAHYLCPFHAASHNYIVQCSANCKTRFGAPERSEFRIEAALSRIPREA